MQPNIAPLFRLVLFTAVSGGALLHAQPAAARCATGGLRAWPATGGSLPANGGILLDAYGTSQALLDNLASLNPRFETSKGHAVAARVLERNTGAVALTQVWIAASVALPEGAEVRLVWDRFALEPSYGSAPAQGPWTVGPEDVEPPSVEAGAIVDAGGVFRRLGCGPEHFLGLGVPAHVPLVRTTLRHFGEELGSWIHVNSALTEPGPHPGVTVRVGRNMCSGPYGLARGGDYLVDVQALDEALNEGPTQSLGMLAP